MIFTEPIINASDYLLAGRSLIYNFFNMHLHFRFISIPKDMGAFNCGAFVAGIVRVRTLSALLHLPYLRAIIYFLFLLEGSSGKCRFPSCCDSSFRPCGGAATTTDNNFD